MIDPVLKRAVFQAVILLPNAKQRSDYLDAACEGNVELRQQIEDLLLASDDELFMQNRAVESFVEPHLSAPNDHADEVDSDETIGRYRLLQRIGEGGFGIVYMAEQQKPVVRRVALKIIKPGMDSKQVVARFEAERQALALMEHANIAQVFDAGETKSGSPYFVMELVRGVPVIEFCDEQKLTNESRLALFRDICGAVQHAHQKGVIHRDLKPSNILVTIQNGEAVPKVIDFGIAKATQQRLTEKTLFTRFEQFVGTPAYMSPEQAQMTSLDVDTRSDIYSLGVLLYELLTGTTPLDVHRIMKDGFEELCRRIREEESELPSSRISSLHAEKRTNLASNRRLDVRSLKSSLRSELDWIVMKAIDKDRRRRYESAAELSADVLHYLRQEPVDAVPPSMRYKLGKFVYRNKTSVIALTAIVVSLLIGTCLATWGMFRAIEQRTEVETARKDLEGQVGKTIEALRTSERETQRALLAERGALKANYFAEMQLAWQALQMDNLALARRILERTRHYQPENDPRHWEWRALWMQCRDKTEKTIRTLGGIPRMDVSPDGRWLAAAGGSVEVWDLSTGEMATRLKIANGQGCTAKFAKDGNVLFVIDAGGELSKWTVPEFHKSTITELEGVNFSQIATSPDNNRLIAITQSGDAIVWDHFSNEVVKRPSQVPSKKRVALAVAKEKLAIWQNDACQIIDVPTWKEEASLAIGALGNAIEFSPDTEYLATVPNRSQRVFIHRISDGEMIGELDGHRFAVEDIAYSPDGTLIASTSRDQTIRLWNAVEFTPIAILRQHESWVYEISFSADGKRLFSTGRDGRICVWNLADVTSKSRFPIRKAKACEWWQSVSFSPDGRLLATTRHQERGQTSLGFDLRSTATLELEKTLSAQGPVKTGVRFSPVDDKVVVGDRGGNLEFFDLKNGKPIDRMVVQAGESVFPMEFTPDGKMLVVHVGKGWKAGGGANTRCAVVSISDKRILESWQMQDSCDCVAISPDGDWVATGHYDGVHLRNLHEIDGTLIVPTPMGDSVVSVDFSPDGKHLIAGTSRHNRIEVFDMRARKWTGQLLGHTQQVSALQFSPDGNRVASAGSEFFDSVRIWDFESQREVAMLNVNGRFNRQIEWSQDGNSLLVMGGDSVVSIWRVPSMTIIEQSNVASQSRSHAW